MTSKKNTVIRMFKYLLYSKWTLTLALFLTVLANVLSLAIPNFSGKAIDAIKGFNDVDFDIVYHYVLLMIVCVLCNVILAYITDLLIIRISTKTTSIMRKEMFDHLLTLPVSYFDNNQAGDIISKISYDIDTINTSLSSDLIMVLTTAVTVTGSFIMMFKISKIMCLLFVITLPIILYITRYRAKKVKPLFSLRSKKLGELNGFVEEMLSGVKTIKGYGQEETINDRFINNNKDAVDAYYTADYQGTLVGPIITFVNNLSLALVSGFGAILYLIGSISLGNISSFILYSRKYSGPISELANVYSELQSAISAANRVFALLDEPSEKADASNAIVLDNVKGEVKMENVKFSYIPGIEVIHGLDLLAKPGKMVAIVGPTGAGKTTIINLLMRFYDIDSGNIKIDGNDIYLITRDCLRKQFSMVLQDTWLFSGTIYENVAYGNDNATLEDVKRVCEAAHISDFIESLKDGYNTVLSDDGVNISKGQKQLLTIARAMLSDSKMLILDEATSNVDSRSEMLIQKAMLDLCKDKTSFVIAHRLSTIKNADLIIVFKSGNIIESGTHAELLKAKGFYASLFNAQWEN